MNAIPWTLTLLAMFGFGYWARGHDTPNPPAGGTAGAIPRGAAETASPQAAVPPAGASPAHPHDGQPPASVAGAPEPPDWIIYGWKCRCRQTITICGQVIDQRVCQEHDHWAKWEAEL